MSRKNPELRDVTEISKEIELHTMENKTFTAIVSFTKGRSLIRYCAYKESLCICALKEKEEAWKVYMAINDDTEPIDPQLN